jgi:3-deoxy-D-manno-octulosonate 8-phosphate phosphatase (KDO 8-P phosphatase)
MSAPSSRRLRELRALVLDVDGVLTDGGMVYGPEGEGFKRFDVKDGLGLRLLRESGLRLALISGEDSKITLRRAEKLRIEEVHLGVEDKEAAFRDLLSRHGIPAEWAAYMGDDLNDLGPLSLAGVAAAPSDAAPEVLRRVRWVTRRPGGRGAVREVCDAILAARRIPLKSRGSAVR